MKAAASAKLPAQILDRLLAMIESGEAPAGSLLPSERDLMRRFEVGRPAVREALQTLANMGLAQIRHGGRARVIEVEPQGLLKQMDTAVRHLLTAAPENREHLREARLLFECGMARLAAARATPAGLDAVSRALDQQRAARGNAAEYIKRDIAFHGAVARLSGNPVFAAVSEALLGWLFGFSPRQLRAPGTEELTLREHEAIVTAIAARDGDAAAFAMRTHLARTHPLYGQGTARARGTKRLKRS